MQGTQIDRDEEIRQLAYSLWQEEGCPDGRDVQHWLKAEGTLLGKHRPKESSKVSTSRKGGKRKQARSIDREL